MERKLNNDQRMYVLRMHAEGIGSTEITKEIKKRFDISIYPSSIIHTCNSKCNEPHIKAFRESYLAKVKSVPIANKRYRMDDLEKERKRLNVIIEKNPLKTRADKSLYLQCTAELRRIIDTAREEMEKKPHLFQNVNVAMGEVNDTTLEHRRQELIGKLRRTLGGGTSRAPADTSGAESEDI